MRDPCRPRKAMGVIRPLKGWMSPAPRDRVTDSSRAWRAKAADQQVKMRFVAAVCYNLGGSVFAMGHYCRHCGRTRPNEAFSGRGHRSHLCKDCKRRPKIEIATADHLDELHGFLFRQSHISQKNIKRLGVLMKSGVPEVATAARLLHEIASVYPHKRRRFKRMCRTHPELMRRLGEAGFIEPWAQRVHDIYPNDWCDSIVEMAMVGADDVCAVEEPSLADLDWYREVVSMELASYP
jgi:hypothetical protein